MWGGMVRRSAETAKFRIHGKLSVLIDIPING
jgi:hypothetical protein